MCVSKRCVAAARQRHRLLCLTAMLLCCVAWLLLLRWQSRHLHQVAHDGVAPADVGRGDISSSAVPRYNPIVAPRRMESGLSEVLGYDGGAYGHSVTSPPSRDRSKTRRRGDFIVEYGVFNASRRYGYNDTVTIATQCTVDYLHHLSAMMVRWEGSVSVAVYAPSRDYHVAKLAIARMRECSAAILERATFHLFYHDQYRPLTSPSPSSSSRRRRCGEAVATSYVRERPLRYPISVARNVARVGADSHFVLTVDIEFLPSARLMSRFVAMVREEVRRQGEGYLRRKVVYAIPVFEVKRTVTSAPTSKRHLVRLLGSGDAIVFHQHKCWACQRIHGFEAWMRLNSSQVLEPFI
ncbi:PREDICTED: beta-1,4-glucuronyltransferase 1-like [Priapulus caudatus]|uniref:Beta-1,4-glucuronyltransferase 1-like n=1 Tax=Priapulus caudatus TaxID=37621 RepID=A0ABM1ELE1_PRICU|nr:PREDICTED: beta-1,4-glucuronyltransferase 1-like [Priapulus caudatus]